MRFVEPLLVLLISASAGLVGCPQAGSETDAGLQRAGAEDAGGDDASAAPGDDASAAPGDDASAAPGDDASAAPDDDASATPDGGGAGADAPAGATDDAVPEGRIQATVETVDASAGAVSLRSAGEPVRLRGTPFQLAGLLPGQEVDVGWKAYGDVRWVTGGGDPGDRRFARSGVVRGVVERREVPQGRLVITTDAGRQVLRGHPEQVGAVVPGQFVEVPFHRVDQTAWLAGTPRAATAGDASGE